MSLPRVNFENNTMHKMYVKVALAISDCDSKEN